MPPGPQQRSSLVVAAGAAAVGLHPYPFPMAINSRPYNGQPACNDCGFCSGYGCPVVARPAALIPLRRGLRTGRVALVPETMATRVLLAGPGAARRATGVSWANGVGRIGSVLGSMLGGVMLSAGLGLPTVFGIVAIPAFISGLSIFVMGLVRAPAHATAAASPALGRGEQA